MLARKWQEDKWTLKALNGLQKEEKCSSEPLTLHHVWSSMRKLKEQKIKKIID